MSNNDSIWIIDLTKTGCDLITISPLKSMRYNCDILFQNSDKKIFGLNSKTGKVISIPDE